MAFGDAVAGTPRRIQFGIARPERIKVGTIPIKSSAYDVREWYLRKTTIDRLTPDQVSIIEELIGDLELG